MNYPYSAVTNRETWFLRMGDKSTKLPKGHPLTVHDEDSGFGYVSIQENGGTMFGSVDSDHYDAV